MVHSNVGNAEIHQKCVEVCQKYDGDDEMK